MPNFELYKYNPDQCSEEELERTFVARQSLLDEIINDLTARIDAYTNQNFLIIGPRGIGKTNMLLMIQNRIKKDSKLSKSYIPLRTSEEEYSVINLRGFLSKIIELLVQEKNTTELKSLKELVDSSQDDYYAIEHTIETLRNYCADNKCKILFLVDNLDLILDQRFFDDAQMGRLRDILMNDSFLILIGTACTYFKEVRGYDRPLYNFFKLIQLEDFTSDQMIEFIHKRAELDNNKNFLEKFEEVKTRINAIYHLTGGNPRLVVMLYQILSQYALPEIRTAIQMLLDDVTPYYKSRLEILAPQQRMVMDTFARLGHPATPTELSKHTHIEVKQINSILKRLRENGFVTIAPQEQRKTILYMVSEQLFRIWHQMRYSTESGQRLEFLINFIHIWYTPKEWEEEVTRLFVEYQKAFSEKRFTDVKRLTEYLKCLTSAAPDEQKLYETEDRLIQTLIESNDFNQAEITLREHIKKLTDKDHLANDWCIMAYLCFRQNKIEDEKNALEKAIHYRPDSYEALNNLGGILTILSQRKEKGERELLLKKACEKLETAFKLKPDSYEILNNWGLALAYLSDLKEGKEKEPILKQVCEKLEFALRIKSDLVEALLNYGIALHRLAELKEEIEKETLLKQAFQKYEAVLKINPQMSDSLYNWGTALSSLAKLKEGKEREILLIQACEKYEKALKLIPNDWRALGNLGTSLHQLALLKDGEEKELLLKQSCEKHKEALSINPKEYKELNNLGAVLTELALMNKGEEQKKYFDEAESKIIEAIKIAKSQKSQDSVKNYSALFIYLNLLRSGIAIKLENIGNARDFFKTAIDYYPESNKEQANKVLIEFFADIITEKTADFCDELLGILSEKNMEEELMRLVPFASAIEYWKKNKDKEVLDRLNPEVREIVEKIIKGKREQNNQ